MFGVVQGVYLRDLLQIGSPFSYAQRLMQTVIREELSENDLCSQAEHVAIIMDGNRRWAQKTGLPVMAGHWKGADTLTEMVLVAADLGIKILTVYAFSTENWSRKEEEIDDLLLLFRTYLVKEKERMVANGVKLETIGDIRKFPEDLQQVLQQVKDATVNGTRIQLVLALNYGGRDDITRATSAIVNDCLQGKLSIDTLSEEIFSGYLDTGKWKDPDLVIRTSGENRLSNFLLWQISYAEMYISEILWPDFTADELKKALDVYAKRQCRFGGS